MRDEERSKKLRPIYPELARRTRIRGVVKLEVVVRPNGSVKSANALGGSPALIAIGHRRGTQMEV